jgi:DNA primase
MIKRETIEQVRQASDIVQVVGSYIPLKKVGKYHRGVCPFHPDKSPSFYVSPDRQVYHCFGCGAGGSVVNFVMQFEKLDFPDAVKSLAKRFSIEVKLERVNVKHQPLYDACEFAAKFFQQQLAKYAAAVNYFIRRGMKDETAARFRLGYAPGGNLLRNAAAKAGFGDELLLKAGLLANRERGISDWFFSRVMFPIMSLSGRVIGFSSRVLDDSEPKYLNSGETDIFRKGDNLYGLFQAKNYIRNDVPILVEGNFDLLALVNRGIYNVVAPLGTAFTFEQGMLLKRFNGEVRVLFDADNAGRNATRRVLDVLLRAGVDPGVVLLPDDCDPDDYVKESGRDKLLELLKQPIDLVRFMERLRAPRTVADRNNCLRELVQLVALIPDAVAQELYVNRIAETFQVAKVALLARVKAAAKSEGTGISSAAAPPVRPRESRPAVIDVLEERLLAEAATDPQHARVAAELMPADTLQDAQLRDIAAKLYGLVEAGDQGLARLSEVLEDDALRRRVASWEFADRHRLTEPEFLRLVYRLRVRWLRREVAAANARGDLAAVEQFNAELARVMKLLQPGK